MTPNLETDTYLRIMCSMLVNAVMFGVGAVAVLATPALAPHAAWLLPVVVIASFGLAPFIAAWIAPRLRLRFWGYGRGPKGDAISG